MSELYGRLDAQGFAVIPCLCDEAALDALADSIGATQQGRERRRGGGLFAIRNLLENPVAAKWAASPGLRELMSDLLGGEAFAVRGIFFDKPPGANWLVPTHQHTVYSFR